MDRQLRECRPSRGTHQGANSGPSVTPLTARSRSRRVVFAVPALSQPSVVFLAELMESGAFRPNIDRVYRLDQIVEANRCVESERKTGNVVLNIAGLTRLAD